MSPYANARFDRTAEIAAIEPDGKGGVFVGGRFSSAGGASVRNLVHLTAGGRVDRSWTPVVDGRVWALKRSGKILYVGGQFSGVGRAARHNAAALSALSGEVLPWNPGPNGLVRVVQPLDGKVFVGGDFRTTGTELRATGNGILVDNSSGSVVAFSGMTGSLRAAVVLRDKVVVGGHFGTVTVGGEVNGLSVRHREDLSPAEPTGLPNGLVSDLAVSGGNVIATGDLRDPGGNALGSARELNVDGSSVQFGKFDVHGRGVSAISVRGAIAYSAEFELSVGRTVVVARRLSDGRMIGRVLASVQPAVFALTAARPGVVCLGAQAIAFGNARTASSFGCVKTPVNS